MPIYIGNNLVNKLIVGETVTPAALTTRELAVYFDTSNATTFTPGNAEMFSIDTDSKLTNKTGSFSGTITSGSFNGNNILEVGNTPGTDFIDLSDQSTFTANATSGSVEMWVSASWATGGTPASTGKILLMTEDSRDKGLMYGGNGSSNGFGAAQFYVSAMDYNPWYTGSMADGWHQLVYNYNLTSGNQELFLDGQLAASYSITGTPGGVNDDTFIGKGEGALPGNGTFDFMILRVYDDVLTADEVLANYNYDKDKVGLS